MTSKKDEIAQQIRQDTQLLVMQDLIRKLTRKCFDRCVTTPGTTFSKSEHACITKCSDRFLEATQVVGKAYLTAAQKEQDNS